MGRRVVAEVDEAMERRDGTTRTLGIDVTGRGSSGQNREKDYRVYRSVGR